jgi:hypothetical protein
MPSQTNSPDTPSQQDGLPATTSEQTKLNRIANEAASRAAKRGQRYDREHDIFTK